MPRQMSEQYIPVESPSSATSSGTGNIQTLAPTSKRCAGAYISVETTDARMTFDGTAPGVSTGPGIVVKAGQAPQLFPFPFAPSALGQGVIKFASNAAGNSLVSVIFVQ